MKNQLSITVDTTNITTLNELSLMFSRLAGAGMIALPEPQIGNTLGIYDGVAELDAVARINAEAKVSQAEYVTSLHGVNETAEEADAAWEAVDSDQYAPTGTIDPSAAFGGSVPPPPITTVPTPPAETSTQPATTAALDSAGMPWDARIHSAAKTKVANGTWKLLRGVDAELVKTVKAEYLGNDVSTPMPNSEPTVKQADVPTTNVAVPPPPSVPAPIVGAMSYEEAIEHLISVKKVSVNIIQARCAANGVASFPLLVRPEYAHLIDTIVKEAVIENEKRLLGAGNGQ